MKRLIAILLLAVMMISCIACQASEDETKDTENEENEIDYTPENPDDIVVSDEELDKGYKIHQGYFYYEDGGYYFYDTSADSIYQISQTIFMPDDIFDGFSTGDTVRMKAVLKEVARSYFIEPRQISLVSDGDSSSIPAEILERFVEKDAPNHE